MGESTKQSKRKMGFIHLPRKYLARAFYRLDSIEDTAGNKTGKVPASWILGSNEGRQKISRELGE